MPSSVFDQVLELMTSCGVTLASLNPESGRVARSLVPLGKAIDTRDFVITENRA